MYKLEMFIDTRIVYLPTFVFSMKLMKSSGILHIGEDIFHRHDQRKPDDTPFTLAFVVNQVISFEAA